MATILSNSHLNLAEAQKRALYDGSRGILAELEETNEILKVAPWYPSSNGSIHKYVKAKALGKGGLVDVNGAIPTLSSQADVEIMQILDYEGLSKIDEKLLSDSENPEAVRNSEDLMNAEGFMNEYMSMVIYGKGDFKGFANLRPALETKRVWSAGGSGSDVTSAWLVEWGEHGVNFRYPNAATPGFINEDRGRQLVKSADNAGEMFAWLRFFAIKSGLHIYNEKCLLRMANIETSGSSNLFDSKIAVEMKNTLPHKGKYATWLVNSTVMTQIENSLLDKANIAFSRREVEGFGPVTYCVGIPVLCMDAILDTESALS